MKRLLLPLLLAVTLAGADTIDISRPQKVFLADGTYVICYIEQDECSDETLVVKDLRTKAKRSIPWEEVSAKQATELRVALGFEVAQKASGMQVDGVKITNRSGGTFIGKLMNPDTAQKDGEYRLKTSDGPRNIPLSDVREGPEAVQLDATLVYTPVELYEKKLAEGAPESARDHFQLAEFCRLVGALQAAKTHYEVVIELNDPQYPEATIRRALARVEKRLASREAENQLKEIKQKIVFKRFPEARELLAKFREAYAADEDLLADAQELEEKLEKDRADYFSKEVARELRGIVKDLLQKKVREEELTLRTAQQYAGGDVSAQTSVSHEAVAMLAEKLGIEPKEVITFWENRSRHAIQKAFYRDGTFIVVESLTDALDKAPKVKWKKGDKGPKPPSPTPALKPDQWWDRKVKARKYTDLRDWLYAWWAEHSNMVEVLDPRESICQTCAGKGYTQQIHQTGQGAIPFFNRCQTCHMATHQRIVQFR